jgi:hypothetical protein
MTRKRPVVLQIVCAASGLQAWQANAIERAVSSGEARVGDVRLAPSRRPKAPDMVLAWEKLAYRKAVGRLTLVPPPTPVGDGPVDLILDFSQAGAPDDSAPLGAITMRFDGDRDANGIAGAVIENRAIEIDIVLTTNGRDEVLASAVYPIVDERTLSPSMQSALGRAELMLSRAILALAARQVAPGVETPVEVRPAAARKGVFSSVQAAGFIAGGVVKRFDRLLQRKEYFLAAVPRTADVEQDLDLLGTRGDVHITFPPPGYFFADPFPFEHDGQEHLFFETYDYATRRGRIDWAIVRPDGSLGPIEPVLVCDYHLSYPFVFEHDGEIYMIPETAQAGRIELWRATEFPRRWSRVGPLIDNINATDATLLRHDGRYWLFATVGQNGASTWDELHGFHSDSLFGPWVPHAASPLKMDGRSARPAGRFIQAGDGRLLRPAQDCSRGYGKALVLNEVEVLDETRFQERTVRRFSPEWMPGNTVFHTLNGSSRFWWIDGKSSPRLQSDQAKAAKASHSVGVFAKSG